MIGYDFDGTLIRTPENWSQMNAPQKRLYTDTARMYHNITEPFVVITARGHNPTQIKLLSTKLKRRYGDAFQGLYLLQAQFKNKTSIKAHKLEAVKQLGLTAYYDNEEDILAHLKKHCPDVKLFLVSNTEKGIEISEY